MIQYAQYCQCWNLNLISIFAGVGRQWHTTMWRSANFWKFHWVLITRSIVWLYWPLKQTVVSWNSIRNLVVMSRALENESSQSFANYHYLRYFLENLSRSWWLLIKNETLLIIHENEATDRFMLYIPFLYERKFDIFFSDTRSISWWNDKNLKQIYTSNSYLKQITVMIMVYMIF